MSEAVKAAVRVGYRQIDTAYLLCIRKLWIDLFLESILHKSLKITHKFTTIVRYKTEVSIGNALQELFNEGVVKRCDMFITTKVSSWNYNRKELPLQLPPSHMRPEFVMEAFEKSLADLKLDYVDLYLIHSPIVTKVVDREQLSKVNLLQTLQHWRGTLAQHDNARRIQYSINDL